jgi:Asp-tRNA(Asn)/Glu-tRNA(Gln) amidotransferase B subunit
MRVDVNVSVMHTDGTFSERVEVKNVAGAKNVERAVEHEFLRHINMI